MTLPFHLRLAGVLLILLGGLNLAVPRYFQWKGEMKKVDLLARRVFFVHAFFIALTVTFFGALQFFCAPLLLRADLLSRALLGGMLLFWACRLYCQWFVYDAAIWRGHAFYTTMHVMFSLLWIYFVAVLAAAFRAVW
jgi:hypothetical protein